MGILDSLSKNPSVLALAALGIGLFVFRDKISEFFSNITGGVEGAAAIGKTTGILNENLQGNLTGIQDILSGDIFKDFKFPELPSFNFEFPSVTIPDIDFPNIFEPRETTDITETPAAEGRASDRGRTIPEIIESIIPSGSIQSGIQGQQFTGGGPSFIGGSVTEIPIERLSLGQIIERLGVTASQAASLRAEAIGFTPEEQAFLNQGETQTSGGFEGLTPEQIALRLTGGIISNF